MRRYDGSMGPEILVVDDDPPTCELVARMLRAGGYRAAISPRPDHALAWHAEGKRFSLAILDVVMPGMGGDGLAARLRRDDPDLKVLFVTGHPDMLFLARPVLWENEAFLEKPFTQDGLLEAVSLLLYGQAQPPASPVH
jgi:two-component system cell cycle sensor histidine kinase/response regulator CckA